MSGLVTLFCIGLACGTGAAGVPPAKAQALGMMPQRQVPSAGHLPLRVPAPGISRSLPAHGDNPVRILAGDSWSVPAPLIVLPSRGTPASPLASAGNGDHGDVLPPASRAYAHWVASPVAFGGQSVPAGQNAYTARPSRGSGLASEAPASVASRMLFADPGSTASSSAADAAPTRPAPGTQPSALGLERVLDTQPSLPGASLPLALRPDGRLGDLTVVKQRRANAAGLKMRHARRHPAYRQARHAAAPQPTATAATYAQAAYVATATPTPTPTPSASGAGVCGAPNGTARTFYITGYLPTGNPTASGVMPHLGTVAIDPRVVPMGSIVCIQGLGQFHAEDTGGAIVGNRIDVFETSLEAAYAITGYRLAWWIPS